MKTIYVTGENKEHSLYIQLYEYFKHLIVEGIIKPGDRLPSIRKCAIEREVSKTTVEASYMQLTAEGYVRSIPGSGYYVSEIGVYKKPIIESYNKHESESDIKYDFTTASVDDKSFNFELWRRYMKSALRNTERLIGYGDAQGEYDLRVALTSYVKENRGVVCTPEQIVIGAGVQIMINLLCSLIDRNNTSVAFIGRRFPKGEAIFEDRGFSTLQINTKFAEQVSDKERQSFIRELREKNIKIAYTFPSHMNEWGDVMPVDDRVAFLNYAKENDALIIEDDYDSEFRYMVRPIPALQSIDGGQSVVYIGSFSRTLLPSLRLAFMVLPVGLIEKYRSRKELYNQTASTAEQIALCQFIRDGHLKKQIRKARKLYQAKAQNLCKVIENVFKDKLIGSSAKEGFGLLIEVKTTLKDEEIQQRAKENRIKINIVASNDEMTGIFLSYSSIDEEDFHDSVELLYNCI